jgi:hypothetical protein
MANVDAVPELQQHFAEAAEAEVRLEVDLKSPPGPGSYSWELTSSLSSGRSALHVDRDHATVGGHRVAGSFARQVGPFGSLSNHVARVTRGWAPGAVRAFTPSSVLEQLANSSVKGEPCRSPCIRVVERPTEQGLDLSEPVAHCVPVQPKILGHLGSGAVVPQE